VLARSCLVTVSQEAWRHVAELSARMLDRGDYTGPGGAVVSTCVTGGGESITTTAAAAPSNTSDISIEHVASNVGFTPPGLPTTAIDPATDMNARAAAAVAAAVSHSSRSGSSSSSASAKDSGADVGEGEGGDFRSASVPSAALSAGSVLGLVELRATSERAWRRLSVLDPNDFEVACCTLFFLLLFASFDFSRVATCLVAYFNSTSTGRRASSPIISRFCDRLE